MVVKHDDIVRAHVHTFDPGAALGYASSLGSLRQVKVEDMDKQHRDLAEISSGLEMDIATVAVVQGDGMQEVFRKARELKKPGQFAFVDFKQYLPSYSAPASFIASPIFASGKLVGVLMFQMPLDRITEVMSERAGLGETGDAATQITSASSELSQQAELLKGEVSKFLDTVRAA